MRTSEKRIKDPLKAIIAILIFFIFSALVLGLYMLPDRLSKNQDYSAAIVGSSRAKWGIDSEVIYNSTGIRTLNMSTGPAAIKGRYEAISGALQRYDLDTVILEIGYDAFNREDVSKWSVYDSVWVVPKMVTFRSAADYVVKDAKIPVYDLDKLTGAVMDESLNAWASLVTGNFAQYSMLAGSGRAQKTDMSLSRTMARFQQNTKYLDTYYNIDDMKTFWLMVKMCKDSGARVIAVTLPNTESLIWQTDGWDYWRWYILDMLKDLDCEYYDFNLYRQRWMLFSDKYSFRDESHLSAEGSEMLSRILADEILSKSVNDIDVEKLFYDNYSEAKRYLSYRIGTEPEYVVK